MTRSRQASSTREKARRRCKRKRRRLPEQHAQRSKSQPATAVRPYCDVCDCLVSGSLQQHLDGIRHRRNGLSLKFFGERHHLVESIFESGWPRKESIFEPGRDREESIVESGWAPEMEGARGGPARRDAKLGCRGFDAGHVKGVALRELVHHAGAGAYAYAKAAEQFTEAGLRRDWARMEAELSGTGAAWLKGGIGPITPGQLAALACLIRCRGGGDLTVIVALQADDHLAASTAAALCLFFDALASNVLLRKLTLRLAPWRGARFGSQARDRLRSRWRVIMRHLGQALAVNVLLQEIRLEVPAFLVGQDDLGLLRRGAEAAPVSRRLAVLMGTHARAGRDSPLRALPRDVVDRILELAVPRRPCAVEMAVTQLPGMEAHAGPDIQLVNQFL
eukprot:evm.model.scf_2676.1 EVM.evm.TU.scf_2676.1   scf_2676:4995-6170(+)